MVALRAARTRHMRTSWRRFRVNLASMLLPKHNAFLHVIGRSIHSYLPRKYLLGCKGCIQAPSRPRSSTLGEFLERCQLGSGSFPHKLLFTRRDGALVFQG